MMRTEEEFELEPKVAAARRRLEQAFAMWETTERVEVMRAQLEARIENGEHYLAEHPGNKEASRQLGVLCRALEKAKRDATERAKYHRWDLARKEFLRAEKDYLRQLNLARREGPKQMVLV